VGGELKVKGGEMIRIGIVGSDNSHAISFSRLCNREEEPGHVRGAKVLYLFGFDEARNREVAEEGAIPEIVSDPREMLGKVDAVMVVFRHGDLHAKYALPFIRAGVATFVDKPFSIKPSDARRMIAAAEKARTPITSYSTLRFATKTVRFIRSLEEIAPVTAGVSAGPADRESEYGGIFFYGVHAVELMLATFGTDVKSLRAVEQGKKVLAAVKYGDGKLVALELLGDAKPGFHLVAYGQGARAHEVDTSTCYREGMKAFLKMVRTGEPPIPYDEMLLSVEVLQAVERSLRTGREVRVGG